MTLLSLLATALLLGFFGGTHCIGMCGGLITAMSMALPQHANQGWRRYGYLLLFSLGRILSYALAGIVFSTVGYAAIQLGGGSIVRMIAGALLIAMGLYIGGFWMGLKHIERLGKGLWSYLQPLMQRLIPIRHAPHALLVGILWGWLPCGLVYSSLVTAVSYGTWWQAALFMFAFGVGTLPAVLCVGVLAERVARISRKPLFRRVAGVTVIVFGIWTLYGVLFSHAHHHAGMAASSESSSQNISPSDATMAPMHHHHH